MKPLPDIHELTTEARHLLAYFPHRPLREHDRRRVERCARELQTEIAAVRKDGSEPADAVRAWSDLVDRIASW